MATKYDPTSDAATFCRHNGHYCPGCPCECHAEPTPTPGAPLAASNPTCARCHTVIVAEAGDTCATIPHWQRGAFAYCTEPELPPYNPEDGAPCAQCGHGRALHYNGRAECWETSDTTPPVGCPCPQYQSHEAAQRADEADLAFAIEGTPEGDAARWLANRGLPPMAGGSGEDADDPAGLGATPRQVYRRNRTPREMPHGHHCNDCGIDWECTRDPCYGPPNAPFSLCDACIEKTIATLPPMAGGAPSHYTDPAWLADEAWALQAERNAESARGGDYFDCTVCNTYVRPEEAAIYRRADGLICRLCRAEAQIMAQMEARGSYAAEGWS